MEIDDIFLEKKFSKNNFQKQISPKILKVAKKVAAVTSKKGKVWGDIKNQFNADEWFSQNVKFELHHTSTQGDNAVYEICEIIEKINTNKLADIILLARGGGDSKLRNAVFNDKDLIEYISKTMIPIIAGIGHNDDITFTDLMVHESCYTPTAAVVKIINSVKPEKS
ncbi:MAG: exodeoxyribonuclease VII large subunit ['Conium maculatum' witches'-broom phytoplasma]|nr:exodeoxyribonuclease VII large subunit ['Conium maculatum' witches'-broom phytoplasma]